MSVNTLPNRRIAPKPPEKGPSFDGLPIGGITPFTTTDFPGKLAAVLFVQGCAWRCQYCHNPTLWPYERPESAISGDKIRVFLEARKYLLEGIAISGGEPTCHEGLYSFILAVKSMGFSAALHTNGMFPEALSEVLPLCDWVAMDVKAPLGRYDEITLSPGSGEGIEASIRQIVECGVEYEFRTTLHPDLLSEEEIFDIASHLSGLGARSYALQGFSRQGCANEKLKRAPAGRDFVSHYLRQRLGRMFEQFTVRLP